MEHPILHRAVVLVLGIVLFMFLIRGTPKDADQQAVTPPISRSKSDTPQKPPKDPLPLGSPDWEAECGDEENEGGWQAQYTALHKSIMSSEGPRRRTLVSVGVEAGLADRLSGVVTEFLFALLTRRAFLHTSYYPIPNWDTAYTFPHINTASLPPLAESLLEPLKFTYKGERNYMGERPWPDPTLSLPANLDPTLYHPLYLINNSPRNDILFGTTDLNTQPDKHSNVSTLLMASNRGRSYLLFDNPHHNRTLLSMGLRRESALGCVMHYLFTPKPEACGESCRAIHSALIEAGKQGVLRVGIHVRVGDHIWNPRALASVRLADPCISCADEIVATRTAPTAEGQPKRLYYLISDSMLVRSKAKDTYGDHVITDLDGPVMHTDCAPHNPDRCHQVSKGLAHATMELYLFSLCDVHVVSTHSGFGLLGAWMSSLSRVGRPRANRTHIYRVETGMPRSCRVEDADPPDIIALHRTGF